ALFEGEHEGERRALQWAVNYFNLSPDFLSDMLLSIDEKTIEQDDSFAAQDKVCRMTQEGIAAIFGPVSRRASAHVQSMCDVFEIPQLQWQRDYETPSYFSLSLYPHYLTLSRAYRDVITYYGWESFAYLYEDNDGLLRVQEILTATSETTPTITFRKIQVDYSGDDNYATTLRDLKDKEERRFVIDCKLDEVRKILREAARLNMMSDRFHYIFTTLDLGLVDLDDFKQSGANITAYRLINPNAPRVTSVRADWLGIAQRGHDSPLMGYSEIKTETALVFDAVSLFARALHELSRAVYVSTESLSCDNVRFWTLGNSLLNYMKSMDFEGLSGRVRFDYEGRTDFSLDLVTLRQNGLVQWCMWMPLLLALPACEAKPFVE
ncbi:hypothetical protein BaRGS_00040224, partial [Batillaria attramentaria]